MRRKRTVAGRTCPRAHAIRRTFGAPVAEAQAVEPPASVEHPRPDPIRTTETSPEPDGAEPPPTPAGGATPARSTEPLKRHSTKAEGKLEKAFRFLTDVNDDAERRDDKYFVNESILFTLTGCFRPAVARFVAAREEDISELNRKHGLGPGHNRGKARTQPDALPTLIKTFKNSVLNPGVDQPF